MNPRRQDFVLGLAVILFITLMVGTFLYVYPRSGAATRAITVQFRHDEGMAPLKEGSPVTLGGALEVGKVTSVRRDIVRGQKSSDDPSRLLIFVDARIEEDLPLYADCQLTTDQPPIGGAGTLVILSVGTPGKALITKETIVGLPPQSLAAAISGLSRRLLSPDGLVDRLGRMLDDQSEGSLAFKLSTSLTDVNAMTLALRSQLNAGDQAALLAKVHRIVENLGEMSGSLRDQLSAEDKDRLLAKVNAALDTLNLTLGEAKELIGENRPAILASLSSVQNVTRTLDEELLAKLKRDFDRDDPGSLLGKLHLSMDQLNSTLSNVETMSETARSLVVSNRPALEKLVSNLKDMSEQLKIGVRELVLAPWRLLENPADADRKRLDVFHAARSFAEAAALLDDATLRLEAISKDKTTDGRLRQSDEDIRRIQEQLRSAFDRYKAAESHLFELMK